MTLLAEPLQGVTKLSTEDIARYHEDGYLAIEGLFTKDEVAVIQAAFDEFVERSRSLAESDDVFDLEPSHTAENPKLRRVKYPHLRHPAFANAQKNDKVLDVVAQLIGKSIRRRAGKLNSKPPFDGSPVEWHQDWAFFPHTNDDVVVVGIAINDQTEENGCLQVVPGSHKGPIMNHHQDGVFQGAVNPAGLAERAVALPLRAGGISLHHIRMLHGSGPNTSADPRLLMLFTYAAGDAWPLTHDNNWDHLSADMLRGELNVEPRMKELPVRLPFPRHQVLGGSIFEVQQKVKERGFGNAMS